jgi:hypothetical protein
MASEPAAQTAMARGEVKAGWAHPTLTRDNSEETLIVR